MSSSRQAKYILTHYEADLEKLQAEITSPSNFGNLKTRKRLDEDFIPNIVNALKAISTNATSYKKILPDPFDERIRFRIGRLPDKPSDALKELLRGKYSEEFSRVIDCYTHNKPELADLKKRLHQFHNEYKTSVIVLYKSKNDELAVQFATPSIRDQAITLLGGQQPFPENDRHNAGKRCPVIYEHDLNVLYFNAYIAKNGELAAVFPTSAMRAAFINLLRHAPSNCMSTYDGQAALYFNDTNLHTSNYHINVMAPQELSNDPYVSTICDMQYAARMIGQGIRQNSLFATLPRELVNKIIIASIDSKNNSVIPPEKIDELINNSLDKPGIKSESPFKPQKWLIMT